MVTAELVRTENEYLLAKQNRQLLAQSTVPGVASGAGTLLSSAAERLKPWGIPEREIHRAAAFRVRFCSTTGGDGALAALTVAQRFRTASPIAFLPAALIVRLSAEVPCPFGLSDLPPARSRLPSTAQGRVAEKRAGPSRGLHLKYVAETAAVFREHGIPEASDYPRS